MEHAGHVSGLQRAHALLAEVGDHVEAHDVGVLLFCGRGDGAGEHVGQPLLEEAAEREIPRCGVAPCLAGVGQLAQSVHHLGAGGAGDLPTDLAAVGVVAGGDPTLPAAAGLVLGDRALAVASLAHRSLLPLGDLSGDLWSIDTGGQPW